MLTSTNDHFSCLQQQRVPAFCEDRLERYVAWYDRYLKVPVATPTVSN